jgi:mitochondrial import inner membrane translocase subunit TIM54
MIGLPNMRLRLPSRNWMIFLSIAGSFSAAVIYDKRETKRAQRKWSKMVEHLASEPLDPRSMPRRLTIFLEGPPADGLRVAQEHFKEYVKPILVSSGLDWRFIQGRKEGDVRAALAEEIRKLRMPADEVSDDEDITMRIRRQNGVKEFDGPQGDIVIGRHTWKEYIRGLHEGWLGPLTAPTICEPENRLEDSQSKKSTNPDAQIETLPGITIVSKSDEQSLADGSSPAAAPEMPSDKVKKSSLPPPFISTSAYSSAPTPTQLPPEFDPSVQIPLPHILGFLNTPTRLYRFLNRRHLADSIGRETAAIVLSTCRHYYTPSPVQAPSSVSSDGSSGVVDEQFRMAEQAIALISEEEDWHKSVHKHTDGEPERTWLEGVVLDQRIASRMRRAELTQEDEKRAARIIVPEEEIEGWVKGSLRKLWRAGKENAGLGPEKRKAPQHFDDEE